MFTQKFNRYSELVKYNFIEKDIGKFFKLFKNVCEKNYLKTLKNTILTQNLEENIIGK